MRAGQKRKRVTIQQDIGTTRDGSGQPIENWQIYALRWASIKPLSGRELFTSQQRWPEVDTDISLRNDRKNDAITPKMRVQHNGRLYNILGVLDPEKPGDGMLLKCRKEG